MRVLAKERAKQVLSARGVPCVQRKRSFQPAHFPDCPSRGRRSHRYCPQNPREWCPEPLFSDPLRPSTGDFWQSHLRLPAPEPSLRPMNGIKLFRFLARQLNHPGGNDLQTRLLETVIDRADGIFCNRIRFDDGQSTLKLHENSSQCELPFYNQVRCFRGASKA